MTRTIVDRRTRIFDGDVFLALGCAIFRTEHGIYIIEDEGLCGEIVSLLRDCGVTDHTSAEAVAILEVEAEEVVSVDYESAGFGYPEHRIPSTEYVVKLMTLTKGDRMRWGKQPACNELAGLEIRREF